MAQGSAVLNVLKTSFRVASAAHVVGPAVRTVKKMENSL
jgi:hypothetical protein